MKANIFFPIIVILFAFGCSDSLEAVIDESVAEDTPDAPITYEFTADQSRAAEASLPFMEKFWLAAEEQMGGKENYIVSPLSADILLSMVANTSIGPLGNEITAALGCEDKTVLNELASKYVVALPTIDDQLSLGIFNGVWYKNEYDLNPTFGDKMKHYYEADIAGNPFDETLLTVVNGWCNDKTHGLIPEILKEVPDKSVMVIADALYLKGAWANPFDAENTTEATFHGLAGNTTVKMMFADGMQHYTVNENFQAIRMEIGSGAIEAVFILPKEGKDMNGFLSENMDAIRNAGYIDTEVDFYLPRFRFVSDEIFLNPLLAPLGMPTLGKLDSSDALIGCDWLKQYIYQRTSLEFDEKGAEGAAVTWSYFCTAPGPEAGTPTTPVVKCNRPFYVMVRVAETGAPLFAGRINNI